jgi:hypothetical protein
MLMGVIECLNCTITGRFDRITDLFYTWLSRFARTGYREPSAKAGCADEMSSHIHNRKA